MGIPKKLKYLTFGDLEGSRSQNLRFGIYRKWCEIRNLGQWKTDRKLHAATDYFDLLRGQRSCTEIIEDVISRKRCEKEHSFQQKIIINIYYLSKKAKIFTLRIP